jgi:hypothetical protein
MPCAANLFLFDSFMYTKIFEGKLAGVGARRNMLDGK